MVEQTNWSGEENRAIVENYLSMLKRELAGVPFNKSRENAELRNRLVGRSRGSVEFKHQNISAVLLENGWVYIDGYKPAKNVQNNLRNEVERQLGLDRELDIAMAKSLEMSVARSRPREELEVVAPPEGVLGAAEWTPRASGIKRDYVYRDSRNRQLGLDGELTVVEFERQRLRESGRPDLSERVEHVSFTVGDGLGYDVRSYEINGAERFIEVKTTLYARETPFFVSRNEVRASEYYDTQFQLYRLFQFTSEVGMYQLEGSIHNSCDLRPENYVALPR